MQKKLFQIGDAFKIKSGKVTHVETIKDILTTTNARGEIVNITYLTEHDFCGQKITAERCTARLALSEKINK